MPAVIALLGPTNTGKTYHAVERLLAHATGMIGFPLRLLARENYDRLVALRGAAAVALVTGEERILPAAPSYFVCTVEAMPLDRRVDFLAVDEIQHAADRERGHVFTDRLLHARGLEETMFLGAETIRPLLAQLVPEAGFIRRERLSTLSYAGHKKVDRLPRRSAIVVFSLADLYAVAERVRHETGGAAVVFGALSPRRRCSRAWSAARRRPCSCACGTPTTTAPCPSSPPLPRCAAWPMRRRACTCSGTSARCQTSATS